MRTRSAIENQSRREAARGRLERTLMSLRNADTLLHQQVVASNSRELPQPISQDYGRQRPAQIFHTPVAVRQPLPQEVFRYHPDPAYTTALRLLHWQEHREYYFVAPELQEQLSVDMLSIRLHTCVNRRHQVFLLPLRVSDRRGRQDHWLVAMNQALAIAREQWIRLVRQPGKSVFQIRPMGFDDPPKWPQMNMEAIVNLAFLNEFYIDSLDHPAVKALLGRRKRS